MIEQFDVEKIPSFGNLFGNPDILLAGFQISGRMIVCNKNSRSKMFQRSFKQNTNIHDRTADSAGGELRKMQNTIVLIHKNCPELLCLQVAEIGFQKLKNIFTAGHFFSFRNFLCSSSPSDFQS